MPVQYSFEPGGQDRDRPVVVNGGVDPEALCLRGVVPDYEAGLGASGSGGRKVSPYA